MRFDDPYHEGEKAVQNRAGEQAVAERNGRAINTEIMPGALKFISQQAMVVLGSVDLQGRLWASIVTGEPGFAHAPDQSTVLFNLEHAGSHHDDPLWNNLVDDPRIGALFIELSSRRRLRVNGRVEPLASDQLRLQVDEAYPNCPKYIQRRHIRTNDSSEQLSSTEPMHQGQTIGDDQRELIEHTDTVFVASAHPKRGVDASHRGGHPGFVSVLDNATLRVPDYPGNSMYNTLGNFQVNPQAGLIVPDFNGGRVLQMTGSTRIRWDLAEQPNQPTGGTERYWDFTVERWIDASLDFWSSTEFLDRWDGTPTPDSDVTG